jgi:putative phosphoesterase
VRIGVLADSHDRLPTLELAFDLFEERGCEAVIHAGDFVAPFAVLRVKARAPRLYWVFGNNDGEREGIRRILEADPGDRTTFELDGTRFAVAHRQEDLPAGPAAVCIFGHTHETMNERSNGRRYLNPGECCGWLTGRPTVAILETASRDAEIVTLT